jgi:hypothetical protein
MRRSRLTRVTAAVALGLGAVLLGAAPAGAHGGSGPGATDAPYYRTEVTGVSPAVPGVTASADPAGDWIGLTNTGPAVVIVLGYTREPYLRLTATGADENELSPTTYINRALFADSVPTGTDTTTPPSWKQVATTGSVRWHDHRIHWMGQNRPPEVAADPTHPHPVGTWTVHATADGVPFDVTGTLSWVGRPDSSRSPWLYLLASPLVVLIAVAAWRVLRRRGQPSAPALAAAAESPAERVYVAESGEVVDRSR